MLTPHDINIDTALDKLRNQLVGPHTRWLASRETTEWCDRLRAEREREEEREQ